MIVPVIHRSLSQNNREFDLFLLNFEQLLNDISTRKPAVPIITSDYNAKDLLPGGLMILEGTDLYLLKSSNKFSQLINEPTHVHKNHSEIFSWRLKSDPHIPKRLILFA